MKQQPVLITLRLKLRPFIIDDALTVHSLVSDIAIASTTINIPHPYLPGMAEAWITQRESEFQNNKGTAFAVELKHECKLVGAVGLMLDADDERAEIGYYIGKSYWGLGYGTEAVGAVIAYGFEHLKLNKIFAHHFTRNPASGRVLQKNGMLHEGSLRQHTKKWGHFEDIEVYGILSV